MLALQIGYSSMETEEQTETLVVSSDETVISNDGMHRSLESFHPMKQLLAMTECIDLLNRFIR
jgi:hypothetical protein